VTTFLLDTNAWVAHLRQKDPALTRKIQQADPADLLLCSVVVGEQLYGAYHSQPPYQANNLGLVAALRSRFVSVPFDVAAAEEYGKVRADLATKGMPIGPNDLLIAAIARANGLTLVTHNTIEFSRVVGLLLDDWQI